MNLHRHLPPGIARCASLLCGVYLSLLPAALSAQCPALTITVDDARYANTKQICLADATTELPTFRLSGQAGGASVRYVLTDRDFGVLLSSDRPDFNLSAYGPGLTYVFAVSYRGLWVLPDSKPGRPRQSVFTASFATACAQLSPNYATVEGIAVAATSIEVRGGGTAAVVCVEGGAAAVGFVDARATASQYVWLITDTLGRIRHLRFEGFHDFQFDEPGVSRVYGLAYSDALLVRPGSVLGRDPLAAGCADLSDNFLTVRHVRLVGTQISVAGKERLSIDAEADARFTVVTRGGQVSNRTYVVIEAETAIIRLLSGSPQLDLSGLPKGRYLAYEYQHTGSFYGRVGEPLWGRAPADRLAQDCFLNSTNALVIEKSIGASASCAVQAGGMAALRSPVEIVNGIARVTAFPTGPSFIPQGYEFVYLLARGAEQQIVAFRADAADFSVTTVDTYRLYRFIGEFAPPSAPDHFPLSSIQLGQTTIAELQARIAKAGICARLSSPALVAVLPQAVNCQAFAGAIRDPSVLVDSLDRVVILSGEPDGEAATPVGTTLFFLLTRGVEARVLAIGNRAEFRVSEGDVYGIHAVVAQVASPQKPHYVDTAAWLGQELFRLAEGILQQRLCADIDLLGAPFTVDGFGGSCTAIAPTLLAVSDTLVRNPGGTVRLEANVLSSGTTPLDFERSFLLTDQAGVILQFGARARFTVAAEGRYRIHAWIGELTDGDSPNFVNTSAIQLGTTKLNELADQYLSGARCGAIDPIGVTFTVIPRVLARESEWVFDSQRHALVRDSGSAVDNGSASAPGTEMAVVSLSNLAGQRLWRVRVPVDGHHTEIELPRWALPSGMYVIQLQIQDRTSSQRLLIP